MPLEESGGSSSGHPGLVTAGMEGVNLTSEQGKVIWRQIDEDIAKPKAFPEDMLSCVGPGWINVFPGERVSFGKEEGSKHNDIFDFSLSKAEINEGFVLAPSRVEDGDIVLSAWSNGIDMQPAKFRQQGARFWLELVEQHKVGERCFVIDETGRRLVSASMASDGNDSVRLVPPRSFVSWLWAIDSVAAKARSDRFEVEGKGDFFSVHDLVTRKKYVGRYKTPDRYAETEDIYWALTSDGMGGLVLDYVLRKA